MTMQFLIRFAVILILLTSTAIAQPEWTKCELPVSIGIHVVEVGPQGTIYAGANRTGIFRSTDGGSTWELNTTGMTNNAITDIAITSTGTVYASSEVQFPAQGTVMRSTDMGATWQEVAQGLEGSSITSLAVSHDDIVYAAGYRQVLTSLTVYRLDENGQEWHAMSLGETDVLSLTVDANGTLFAGTSCDTPDYGIFNSTDGGETWEVFSNGLDDAGGVNVMETNPSGSTIYAAAFTRFPNLSDLYRSTDFGVTWDTVSVKDTHIPAIAIDDNDVLYTCGKLLGGSTFEGVCRTSDNGDTWEVLNEGLPTSNVTSIAIGENHVFAGTLNGLFRLERQASSVDRNESVAAEKLDVIVHGSAPSATMHVTLVQKATITAHILNSLGQIVSTPAHHKAVNAGSTIVPLDIAHLPNGMYFVRVATDQSIKTVPVSIVR